MAASGLAASDVLFVRHTFGTGGLSRGASSEEIIGYTQRQDLRPGKMPADPPATWLVFAADGGRRSRFQTAYANAGELVEKQTAAHRYFDLRESDAMSSLRNRLVVEWPADTINWAKLGGHAERLPILEIADPEMVVFPGYDLVLIDYNQLQFMVEDPRWAEWRVALNAVQGIYLIADRSTGQMYVGKADGGERIFGRWRNYARDGHGGNLALKALIGLDPDHRKHFVFSILRVFGPNATTREVDVAESHYKKALLTKTFGLNRN
ncbi:GIY-YIG nuclease family protein [Antrihabitans sp. YC2-6]|uniref:GIY-YIG nuclease family protein n=1 Tax=Antrihabitans sp. YC2-6 TaxID=2799498 RepID=UPI0018F46633|nr:GIY-YIG nuclease family protein [Antrihabitans sp. YC2-6]MBJ8348277.1 GIY-YIG nuclease family protein [Antrihabitans sp. YC2-6]